MRMAEQEGMCDLPLSEENRTAHLDPTPDGREEGGGVDDGDLVNGLWIVSCGELRRLLQMTAERPHQAEGDTTEVNNRRRRHDRWWWLRLGGRGLTRRRRSWGRPGEGGAEGEVEAEHELVEGDSVSRVGLGMRREFKKQTREDARTYADSGGPLGWR